MGLQPPMLAPFHTHAQKFRLHGWRIFTVQAAKARGFIGLTSPCSDFISIIQQVCGCLEAMPACTRCTHFLVIPSMRRYTLRRTDGNEPCTPSGASRAQNLALGEGEACLSTLSHPGFVKASTL